MKLVHNGTDWSLVNGNKTILSQKIGKPVIYVGSDRKTYICTGATLRLRIM